MLWLLKQQDARSFRPAHGLALLVIALLYSSVARLSNAEPDTLILKLSETVQLRFTQSKSLEIVSSDGGLTASDKEQLAQLYLSLHKEMYRTEVLPLRGVFSYWTKDETNQSYYKHSLPRTTIQYFVDSASTVVKPGSRCIEWGVGYIKGSKFENCAEKWSFDYDSARPRVDVDKKIVYGSIDTPASHNSLQAVASTFDVVVCTQVFEHIRYPHIGAKGLSMLVKPGGYLLWTAPFMEPNHRFPEDHFRYTLEGAQRLLENVGFQIETSYVGGNAMLVAARLLGFTDEELVDGDRQHYLVNASDHFKRVQASSVVEDLYWGTYIVARKPIGAGTSLR